MTDFAIYPNHEQFRPLKLRDPILVGADVFALQTALAGLGYTLGTQDGVFGALTDKAVRAFQADKKLVIDGIAGPATNNRAVEALCASPSVKQRLPAGLLLGHLAHESSLYPGRVSPRRPDGTYDAGVAQRNTAHTQPRQGFDAPLSITVLALNERQFYDKFQGVVGRRRWLLAAGSWNAPAYACWIARDEGASMVREWETAKPGPTARTALEAYMVAATVRMA